MTIIMRSALIAWGRKPAPEVHSIVDGLVVTWADVMNERRRRQRERLELIRATSRWRAYKLWVAYFDQDIMGGWHAFIEDIRGEDYRIWIDRDRRSVISQLLNNFPLMLPLGSEHDQWERWKPAFAAQFQRRCQDGKPVGVLPFWWNQRDAPRERLTD